MCSIPQISLNIEPCVHLASWETSSPWKDIFWKMSSWTGPGSELPGKMGEVEKTVLIPGRLPRSALWGFVCFLPMISLEPYTNLVGRGNKGEKKLCALSTW